jgi:hypothetical protein
MRMLFSFNFKNKSQMCSHSKTGNYLQMIATFQKINILSTLH